MEPTFCVLLMADVKELTVRDIELRDFSDSKKLSSYNIQLSVMQLYKNLLIAI